MFDRAEFPKPLDESQFEDWLERGRTSKISYRFLLIIWNEFEADYAPVYAEDRLLLQQYDRYESATGYESLVAAYDLYSESRVETRN